MALILEYRLPNCTWGPHFYSPACWHDFGCLFKGTFKKYSRGQIMIRSKRKMEYSKPFKSKGGQVSALLWHRTAQSKYEMYVEEHDGRVWHLVHVAQSQSPSHKRAVFQTHAGERYRFRLICTSTRDMPSGLSRLYRVASRPFANAGHYTLGWSYDNSETAPAVEKPAVKRVRFQL